MKKCIIFAMVMMMVVCMSGCQKIAKNYGGNITIELEPNTKLEEITWKDDSLWYLTRPMRDEEEAETHIFQQSKDFGFMEGSVTVIETKTQEEEE